MLDIPIGSLDIGAQAVGVMTRNSDGLSWAIVLPGLWGVDEVLKHLSQQSSVLRVDGTLTNDRPGDPIRAGLRTVSPEGSAGRAGGKDDSAETGDAGSSLVQWAQGQQRATSGHQLPIIAVEAPELLDELSAEILADLLMAKKARLVAIVDSEETIPSFLRRFRRDGRLQMMRQPLMTARDLDSALRTRLAGPVSSSVLHRMTELCGRHSVLAGRVLQAAQRSGVLNRESGLWRWGAEESGFRNELARISGEILGGFAEACRELLILTAVAGCIPESWAVNHYGMGVVHSLRTQHILSSEVASPRGFLDLHITAEALSSMVISDVSDLEKVRLWYAVGRNISAEAGGPASQATLARWRALAEGRIDGETAERAAAFGMAHMWYRLVRDVAEHAVPGRPALRVLAARAHYALGDTASALAALEGLTAGAPRTGEESDRVAMRSAVLVAERIALFHPELAAPVIEKLRSTSDTSLTPYLDSVKQSVEEVEGSGSKLETMVQTYFSADDQEASIAQLWIGAQYGLRQHPGLGRLVLSALLDDLTREGGYPDVQESAVALLLLITMIHGWRTDVLRVGLQVWGDGAVRSQALPAVADIIATIVAMQQDRMTVAHQYASSAVRTFEVVDPFGLLTFSSSLAAATSTYVDDELSLAEHQRHFRRFGVGRTNAGPVSLRLIAEGMATVGSGPPTEEVAERLVMLAAEARGQGEWSQEQQLLLLELLGHSQQAAQAVFETPWHEEVGRSRMIGMLAQAMTTPSPDEAVDIAEFLIAADAAFFGLSVLAHVWARRQELDRQARLRIIRAVLAVRRSAGGLSWMLRTFWDLILDSRETQVLEGLDHGDSVKVIAGRLYLSPRTVEATISGMFRRFSCVNRVELLSLGLLQD